MTILRVQSGNEKGKTYSIKDDSLVLGRDTGCEVQVLDQAPLAGAGLHLPRPPDDEGHTEGLLVHPSLVVPAVFTEVETLV